MFRSHVACIGHAVCLLFLFSAAGHSQIAGCVKDPSNAAVRGARINLTDSEGSHHLQAQTDEKGCFTLSGVPGTSFQLTVLAEGFSPYEKNVSTEDVSSSQLDVALEIKPVE